MVRPATTKLSSRGQVVIPEEIRTRLGLEPGAQFVVVAEGDVVVLKALKPPRMADFKALLDRAQESAAAAGLEPDDVTQAIRGRTTKQVRAILDTNVLVSAIFFGGVPRRILEAWANEQFELVLSASIFDEYLATCVRLSASRPGLEYEEVLATIAGHGTLVADGRSAEPITRDPDDDKFVLCARHSDAVVVSGDSDLHAADGWAGVEVLRPREFLDRLESSAAT